MTQRNVTTSGSHLANALVTPAGGAADETLANVAQAALSVASTQAPGRVELATTEETAAGADETRAVTPAGLAAQHYIKTADVTYTALNDNGDVGSEAGQVARGDHAHLNASSAAGFMSAADKAKLDGIEAEAAADQTGREIVAAIDTELGGAHWQQGGAGSGEPHKHSADDLPDRGAFYGKGIGASLAGNGGVVDINVPGLPVKATACAADLVPIWDAETAAHRHVPVAGLPAGRGIVTPEGDDPAIGLELPAAVDRRDFLLGFTATGAVTTTKVATAKDVDDLAARGMTTIDTIAELSAARPRRTGGTVYVRGYHKAGDGGDGTFMWDAASTRAPDGGTVFATGSGPGRWLKLYDQLVNIKSFGAKGDGIANDTAAVQRAVDANVPLYVPSGIYLLHAAITWPDNRPLVIIGQNPYGYNGARLVDARAGYPEEPLFHRFGRYMKPDGTYQFEPGYEIVGNNLGGVGSRVVLKDLWFVAGKGPYGHAVELTLCKDSFIENCCFEASFRGLTLGQSAFDTTVINCQFLGTFRDYHAWDKIVNGEPVKQIAQRAWGLHATGHAFLKGINVAGYGVGICLNGTGTSLTGARIEVNSYGLIVGGTVYNMGGTEPSGSFSRSMVSGVSLEANTIAVLVKRLNSSLISGIGAQGSPSEGTRPHSEVGLLVEDMGPDARFENCNFAGYFTRAAIINFSRQPLWSDGGGASDGGGMDRGAVNSPLGTIGNNRPSYYFLKTNTPSGTITAFHDLMLPGLTGLNIRDTDSSGAFVRAKNFGDVVIPAGGATSAAVVFPTAISLGIIAFYMLNPVDAAKSLLAAGQYFYATTVVARHGECGVDYSNANAHNYRTVDIAAGQGVRMTFHGGSTSWLKRRIYRGRKAGWFEGYWDIKMGDSFYDDGSIPFIGKAMPPTNCGIPALTEDDATYQVIATPSWPTTVHVTNKQTKGFTLNFGTAAPDGNQTVSWLMFRP